MEDNQSGFKLYIEAIGDKNTKYFNAKEIQKKYIFLIKEYFFFKIMNHWL